MIKVTDPAEPTLIETLKEPQAYDVAVIDDVLPSNLAQNPDITIWEIASG